VNQSTDQDVFAMKSTPDAAAAGQIKLGSDLAVNRLG